MSERKCWIVNMPVGWLVEPGSQIMIEQFDDSSPTIAFRDHPRDVWGPPVDSVEAL